MPEFKHASSNERQLRASGKAHTTETGQNSNGSHKSNKHLGNSDRRQQSVSATDGEQDQFSEKADLQDDLLVDLNHEQLHFPASTTRVLTDEKGHSIKIRIASPPPQRSSRSDDPTGGGAKHLMQKFRDPSNVRQQSQQQVMVAGRRQQQHRDSLASDCPLISSGNGEEHTGPQEQARVCGASGKGHKISTITGGPLERQADLKWEQLGWQQAKRRHSEVIRVSTTSASEHELSTIGGGGNGASDSTRTATAISDLAYVFYSM